MERTITDAYLAALEHLTSLVDAVDRGQLPLLAERVDQARVFLNSDAGVVVPIVMQSRWPAVHRLADFFGQEEPLGG